MATLDLVTPDETNPTRSAPETPATINHAIEPSTYYTSALGITSQFAHCGLPIRLDTYRGCAIQCQFCFARLRGGNTPTDRLRRADPTKVIRQFSAAKETTNSGMLNAFLRRRVPLHFGGMSDPFQPTDARYHVTSQVLKKLVDDGYPTVISTRSPEVRNRRYLDLLENHPYLVVQFSFSTLDEKTSQQLQPGAGNPADLLRVMGRLSDRGVNVTARWQPYIPSVSPSPKRMVAELARVGARHVGLEHLKIPLERRDERWLAVDGLRDAGLKTFYREVGAVREGREFVLPAPAKLAVVLDTRERCHEHGMTFGAADNDLQFLSDTECCCSGVDQFSGFEKWFAFQIGTAVRRSVATGLVTLSPVLNEWRPGGSVDRHLNSKSRIAKRTSSRGSIEDHILYRWEDLNSPHNPSRIYGFAVHGRDSLTGTRIYAVDPHLASLMKTIKPRLSEKMASSR